MTIAKVLREAEKAQTTYLQAMETAKKATEARETALSKALPLVKTVAQAIKLFELSNRKEARVFACKKAITLLGTDGKAIDNLILVLDINDSVPYTQKDRDFESELEEKKKLIIASASDEELFRLFKTLPRKLYSEASGLFETKATLCKKEKDLEILYDKYKVLGNYNIDSIYSRRLKQITAV